MKQLRKILTRNGCLKNMRISVSKDHTLENIQDNQETLEETIAKLSKLNRCLVKEHDALVVIMRGRQDRMTEVLSENARLTDLIKTEFGCHYPSECACKFCNTRMDIMFRTNPEQIHHGDMCKCPHCEGIRDVRLRVKSQKMC